MAKTKSIGVKLYNGDFLSILGDNEIKIKKVILTTVKDNQSKTIIELYEGENKKCVNNEYLGKIEIPINRKTKKGEPAIEFHLRLDDNGVLYAKAWDLDSGEESEIQIEHSQTQTILPESLSDEEIKDKTEESAVTQIDGYYDYSEYNDYDKNDNIVRKVLLAVAAFILLALLSLGIFLGIKKLIPMFKNEPTVSKENREKQSIVDEKETMKEELKNENVLQKEKPKEKVEEEKVTGVKEVEGKKHYVRWGDNLWNICKKYYNDPWYYPALAEANNILNPRLIYAGTYIIIPPKSSLKRWVIE